MKVSQFPKIIIREEKKINFIGRNREKTFYPV